MTHHPVALSLALAALAALGACNQDRPSGSSILAATGPTSRALDCKQPVPDREIALPIAPRDQRVDLATPTFGNPTSVTNPLFPISHLSQVVLVGFVGGVPFRAETTLLPGTQAIDMGDRVVQTLTSQYVAYLDGRIDEVALDWYAQADDGAVWYFGENVFNYEEGKLADTDGTWIVCKDGPVAMIMPGLPKVGDVYRVENIYPTVFEEIEVSEVNQTVEGPLGPVTGAFTVQQLGLDSSVTPKIFAPGYGEFSTGDGIDIEALALAVPTDASAAPAPAELRAILAGARSVYVAVRSGDWSTAATSVDAMNQAWASHQASLVPLLLKPIMTEALNDLTLAIGQQQSAGSLQSAIDVSRTGLDLLLQFRTRIAVDFARLDLFLRQLVIDTEAGNSGGIAGDVVILRTILDRLKNVGDSRDQADARAVRPQLDAIRTAADRGDSATILNRAERAIQILSWRIAENE